MKRKITLRARNLNGEKLKVNDKAGNPIEIAAVVVWQVEDTFKACFDVDRYESYVIVQSEAAVRHLAGAYPYDTFEDDAEETLTLRAGKEQVSTELEKELAERFERAGIKVIEARISHLAYAPEIAEAMLRRQQAVAVVAARTQIVEGRRQHGGTGPRETGQKQIVELDEEKKGGHGQQPAGRAVQRVVRLTGGQRRHAVPVERRHGPAQEVPAADRSRPVGGTEPLGLGGTAQRQRSDRVHSAAGGQEPENSSRKRVPIIRSSA